MKSPLFSYADHIQIDILDQNNYRQQMNYLLSSHRMFKTSSNFCNINSFTITYMRSRERTHTVQKKGDLWEESINNIFYPEGGKSDKVIIQQCEYVYSPQSKEVSYIDLLLRIYRSNYFAQLARKTKTLRNIKGVIVRAILIVQDSQL